MASSSGGCNMPALSRTVIDALAFVAFAPTAIQACSCVFVGNRCGAWSSQGEGVLFLGKVTAKVSQVRPDASGISDLSVGYAVHFSVEESFYGAAEAGGETVIYTGSGGGDCGYPFVVGTSYLVYAAPRPDLPLTPSTCP